MATAEVVRMPGTPAPASRPFRRAELTEAAFLYLLALGGGTKWLHEVRCWNEEDGERRYWLRAAVLERTLFDLRAMAAAGEDVEVSAVPRFVRGMSGHREASCLWVRVEGGAGLERLSRCGEWRSSPPAPTLVLREGTTQRATALWLLRCPMQSAFAFRANRRIAYHLGVPAGVKCDPDYSMVRVPGTQIREGRRRGGLPVRVAHVLWQDYRGEDVVGHLKDAPDPRAWMDRQEDV
jgi:hypothetical protein